MRDIRIAAAQFEARDDDKQYNLGRIAELTRKAVEQGAEIVSFHDCCVSGYTFLQTLDEAQTAAVAEAIGHELAASGHDAERLPLQDLFVALTEDPPDGEEA